MSILFSRILAPRSFYAALPKPTAIGQRPSILTRVPVRSIHAVPKEYNGLQSAAHHFKRQRHMPYFLEYLMWVVFGSEALHLIWLKMDYKEYKEKTAHKIKLLEELIKRIENGDQIDDNLRQEIRIVLMNNKNPNGATGGDGVDEDIDDEYLNNLIVLSEKQQTMENTVRQKLTVDSTWIKGEDDTSVDADDSEKTNTQKKHFFL
ncbi:hypothetical protein [Parasitella parasitica]|uniref:Uncharacterized protein n=1 Tax=Parasitella parasitica TaxID=35722 RepID=A0A0B7NV89_9FUNG|nr:hypothetical protein [Parasitella parasitica]